MISRATFLGGILLLGALGALGYQGWLLSQDVAQLAEQTNALREQIIVLNRQVQTLNEILFAFRPPAPQLPQTQRIALQAEARAILQEARTLSWAYFKERGYFPRRASDIGLSVPAGSAWNNPVVAAGGGPNARTIRWVVSGNGTRVVTAENHCYLVLERNGSIRQGCNF